MAAPINRNPLWKYFLMLIVIAAAFLYAAPNLYGEYPAVQVMGTESVIVDDVALQTAQKALQQANIPYGQVTFQNQRLLFRFNSTDVQLQAKDVLQQALGDQYLVALNLSSATPDWLKSLGAMPMRLGLDLRGGVHFLLQVDVNTVMQQRIDGDLRGIGQALRDEHIRYSGISRKEDTQLVLQFRAEDMANQADDFVRRRYSEFTWTKTQVGDQYYLTGALLPAALFKAKSEVLDQAMNTLRNRVNELGVSEAVVQQQGESRVSVDLPGIQDTAEAKNILGKTATLEFHMVDIDDNAAVAQSSGTLPPDTRLYLLNNQPMLLKNQIVLRGSSIVSASASADENGRPAVQVRLGGAGDSLFTKTTAENVGKPMAILYVEVKSTPKVVNGQRSIDYVTERRIISAPVINSALVGSFQIRNYPAVTECIVLRKTKSDPGVGAE